MKKHHFLTANHPSHGVIGLVGCKHFSKTNEILNKLGKNEIKWLN